MRLDNNVSLIHNGELGQDGVAISELAEVAIVSGLAEADKGEVESLGKSLKVGELVICALGYEAIALAALDKIEVILGLLGIRGGAVRM